MVIRRPSFKSLAVAATLFLTATTTATASDSGVLSYRAQRSISAGKFAKGYSQLERALLACRKESDLLSEGRVLLAMAQVRTISLDLDLADSLISIVRDEALDQNTRIMKAKVKVALANERQNFKDAARICNSLDKDSISKADKSTQASLYGECAIALAATRGDTEETLKMTAKRSGKKSGFYAFISARVAELSGKTGEADSLYKVAEEKSIQGNKPYNTATILYYRSNLKSTPENESKDLKLRCKNAFELMGLPNNSKRCEE